MTKSESKFLESLKKWHPACYVRKLPDFKQTGNTSAKGLPDYMVFYEGQTLWYEVKMAESKHSFNLNLINEYQWVTFKKMLDNKIDVQVAIYDDNWNLYIIPFSTILKFLIDGKKSFKLDEFSMHKK